MVSTYIARLTRILGGSRFKPFAQPSKAMTETDFFKSWGQPLDAKGRMQRHPRFHHHYGRDAKDPVKMENESSLGMGPMFGFAGSGTKIAKTGRVSKFDLRMLRREDATLATKNIPMGPQYTNMRQGSRFRGYTVRRVPDMSRDKMINPYMIPTTEARVGTKRYPNISDAVYKMERSDHDRVVSNISPKPRTKFIESTDKVLYHKSLRGMPKPKTLARGYTAKPPSRAPPHRVKGYSGKGARKVDKAHFPSEADLDRKLAGKGRKYH